jgi:formylglycine-generating enzyme
MPSSDRGAVGAILKGATMSTTRIYAAATIAAFLSLMSCGNQAWCAQTYNVTVLTQPSSSYQQAFGTCGTQQVGTTGYYEGTDPMSYALLWTDGTPTSCVYLSPPPTKVRNYEGHTLQIMSISSAAFGTDGIHQVGKFHVWGYYYVYDGSGEYTVDVRYTHAALWSGTAANYVDLNPSGFTSSEAHGIGGAQQVGFGDQHALLWSGTAASYVDLNPGASWKSLAYGTNGTQQVGCGWSTASTGGNGHALLWSGTAASCVDLHPIGFRSSVAYGVSGAQQVGVGDGQHALLWSGTAASCVDLNPVGFSSSGARGTNGTLQVGYGGGASKGDPAHALVWSGTAASCIDLNQFLPASRNGQAWYHVEATGIDAYGNICGYGNYLENGVDSNPVALLWQPVPEPATLSMLVLGGLALLPRRKRKAGVESIQVDSRQTGKGRNVGVRASIAAIAALMVAASAADAGNHAPWPTDWNNWNDQILWCTVGDSGNAADTRYRTPHGSLSYEYKIGKYEVTAGQYTAFLNAVGGSDPYGLYKTDMGDPNKYYSSYGFGTCMIERSGSGIFADPFTYSVADNYANRPVRFVSFWDACRFVNWLSNGQPTGLLTGNGAQDGDLTENGAYTLDGYTGHDGRTILRNANAKYAVPSVDEWYKAAYYKGGSVNAGYWDYPTGSDATPGRDMADSSRNNVNYYGEPYPIDSGVCTTVVGEFQNSASPYGTFDQGGNVDEWNESVYLESSRGLRGGAGNYAVENEYGQCYPDAYMRASFLDNFAGPWQESGSWGFRVVEVPEPAALSMLILGGLALLRRRK